MCSIHTSRAIKERPGTSRILNTDATVSGRNGQVVQQFYVVCKPNGKIYLFLNCTRLNQALIRLVHRGPILTHKLPKLTNVCYIMITCAHLGYCSLKPEKKFSYLTTLASQLGRYRFTSLSFGMVPAGDMFH